MRPNIAAAGDAALLADLGDGVSASALHAAAAHVRAQRGVLACIVGQQSLYVVFEAAPDASVLDFDLASLDAHVDDATTHRIAVSFDERDAPDLPQLLAHARMTREAFLARIAEVRLTVRYLGFRAGFAYLEGWPAEWQLPRRATSRDRVPRGSFAVAGAMAGFYPIDSPGGWNLIGRAVEEVAYRFAPGDNLQLLVIPSREHGEGPLALGTVVNAMQARTGPSPSSRLGMTEEGRDYDVIAAGQFTSRVGLPDWSRVTHGLPPGGAFDVEAMRAANRAVGNDDAAGVFECAMVGPRLRFRRPRRVSWYGADADVRVNGVAVRDARQFVVDRDQELAIGRVKNRGWLAIESDAHRGARPHVATLARDARMHIRVMRGPHDARVPDVEWEVTPQLDRIGIRLRPVTAIDAKPPADLRSIGMQCGTIQWHPDGSFVAMGPDHPVTGGYLQPFTVLRGERWKLAQLSPGERVVFSVDG